MTESTHFVALAFDFVAGLLVAGEEVDCSKKMRPPSVAIGAGAVFDAPGKIRNPRFVPREGSRASEPSPTPRFNLRRGIAGNTNSPGTSTMNSHSKKRTRSKRTPPLPVAVALVVAAFGLLGMLIVDYGPWSRVQTAEIANYMTTGAAARAAGATVTPTAPKLQLEPLAPGPKPVQPANPIP
jgi:hypothetical protein